MIDALPPPLSLLRLCRTAVYTHRCHTAVFLPSLRKT